MVTINPPVILAGVGWDSVIETHDAEEVDVEDLLDLIDGIALVDFSCADAGIVDENTHAALSYPVRDDFLYPVTDATTGYPHPAERS